MKKRVRPTSTELAFEMGVLPRLLKQQSDRAMALISAAFLDDSLGSLIAAFCVEDAAVQDRLLGERGVLQSFSSKIDFCYAVGLIAKTEHTNLSLLRKIRNEFAHNRRDLSFGQEPVRGLCGSLLLCWTMFEGMDRDCPKDRFFLVAVTLALMLTIREVKRPRGWWKDFDISMKNVFEYGRGLQAKSDAGKTRRR